MGKKRRMGHLELDPKILAFYQDRYEEEARLTRTPHGRLEFARTQQAALGELGESTEDEVVEMMVTGLHQDNLDGFTSAYFHHPDELAAELGASGLADITIYGVEGPAVGALDAAGAERTERLLPSAIRCAELLETDAALINASAQLVGIGWRR